MIKLVKEKLKEIVFKQDILYLLHFFDEEIGLFGMNNNLVFLQLNTTNLNSETIKTELINFYSNVYIDKVENNSKFSSGYYNLIEFAGNIDSNDFTTFCQLCAPYANDTLEMSLSDFFYSLINLFQLPQEQQYKNLLGLFGELYFIKKIHSEYAIDLTKNWHSNGVFSKYDIITRKFNFEIKSTLMPDNVVKIKHEQLFNDDNNILIVLKFDENMNSGESLFELIESFKLNKIYNLFFQLNIEKELKRISINEAKERKFQFKSVKFYFANSINPFENLPEEIDHLSYNLNLDDFKEIEVAENYFKN